MVCVCVFTISLSYDTADAVFYLSSFLTEKGTECTLALNRTRTNKQRSTELHMHSIVFPLTGRSIHSATLPRTSRSINSNFNSFDGFFARCDLCPEVFKFKHAYQEHKLKGHGVVTGGKVYHCRIKGCSFSHLKRINIYNHVISKHTLRDDREVHQCHACGKGYTHPASLQIHIRKVVRSSSSSTILLNRPKALLLTTMYESKSTYICATR